MNKKAAVSTLLADIYAYAVFGIIAIAFFAIFKLGWIGDSPEYRVKSDEILLAPQVSLQSYLRSPVIFQNNEITIEELAIWSINNNDYAKLEEATKKLFEDFLYVEVDIDLFGEQGRLIKAGKEADKEYLFTYFPYPQEIINMEKGNVTIALRAYG